MCVTILGITICVNRAELVEPVTAEFNFVAAGDRAELFYQESKQRAERIRQQSFMRY